MADPTQSKPRLRGVLHSWAAVGFVGIGLLVLTTRVSAENLWPTVAFAASVVGLFGTSALYHRIDWSSRGYMRMRRLDHAMIFGLVVGTYTPLFLVGLAGRGLDFIYLAVCGISALGVGMTLFWPKAPKWARSVVYLSVGWIGILAAPELLDLLGWSGIALLLGGGLAYSAGAIIYAAKRPNPLPGVFGYHEVFHGFTILAVGMHYAVITFWVL